MPAEVNIASVELMHLPAHIALPMLRDIAVGSIFWDGEV